MVFSSRPGIEYEGIGINDSTKKEWKKLSWYLKKDEELTKLY